MYSLEVPARGHNIATDAKAVRQVYTDYFMHEGVRFLFIRGHVCTVGFSYYTFLTSDVHFKLDIAEILVEIEIVYMGVGAYKR